MSDTVVVERKTAGAIADVTWPTGTRFRVEGSRAQWWWVDRTPTKVKLSRNELGSNLVYREVKRYVSPDTLMEVLGG